MNPNNTNNLKKKFDVTENPLKTITILFASALVLLIIGIIGISYTISSIFFK